MVERVHEALGASPLQVSLGRVALDGTSCGDVELEAVIGAIPPVFSPSVQVSARVARPGPLRLSPPASPSPWPWRRAELEGGGGG